MLTGMGGMEVLLSPQEANIRAKTIMLARRADMESLKRIRNRLNRQVDNVAKVEIIFSFPIVIVRYKYVSHAKPQSHKEKLLVFLYSVLSHNICSSIILSVLRFCDFA